MNPKVLTLMRVDSDSVGNPRFVMSHRALISPTLDSPIPVKEKYDLAVKRSKAFGGSRYRSKSYRCGIVFSSYDTNEILPFINEYMLPHEQYTTVEIK